MTVRILHVADCHLGSPFPYLGDLAAIRRQDLFDTFVRLCDVAIERRVAALLLAGDLFDSHNPPASLVTAVERELARVADAGIRIFAVPGDHDSIWYGRSVWRRSHFPQVHVFRAPTFSDPMKFTAEGVDVTVHGLAYSPTLWPRPLPTLRRERDGIHIALMHATVDPAPHVPAEQRHFPVAGRELLSTRMDYIALGHLHRRACYVDDDRITAVYPGSPEGLDPTEAGLRYAALVDFDGGLPKVTFLPVNGREVRKVRMDVTDYTVEEVVAALRESCSDTVLLTARLVGRPRTLLDLQWIRDRVAPDLFWLALEDETEMATSEAVERLALQTTISGRLARNLQERILATGDAQERNVLERVLKLGLASLREGSAR